MYLDRSSVRLERDQLPVRGGDSHLQRAELVLADVEAQKPKLEDECFRRAVRRRLYRELLFQDLERSKRLLGHRGFIRRGPGDRENQIDRIAERRL